MPADHNCSGRLIYFNGCLQTPGGYDTREMGTYLLHCMHNKRLLELKRSKANYSPARRSYLPMGLCRLVSAARLSIQRVVSQAARAPCCCQTRLRQRDRHQEQII